MFAEYKETTDLLVAAFGKKRLVDDLAADDFEKLRADMAKRWGPVRLGNAITRVKSVFKYGVDNGLIDTAVRYGSEFKKPDKAGSASIGANGEKMLSRRLRRMIDAADVQLRAMILLGLNAGYGNNGHLATLPLTTVNRNSNWLTFARPKPASTAAAGSGQKPRRRCAAIAERPAPRLETDAGLTFINSARVAVGPQH